MKSPQDIGHVRSEDPSVGMEFIDHDEFQILEEGHPLRMMGKDGRVEHVGIGDHDVPLGPNCLSGIRRRISIIRERGNRFCNPVDQILKLEHLILRECLCGEKIQSLGVGL